VRDILLHLGKKFTEIFQLLNQADGRTLTAERSAMSGLSILKRAECWSVKIPGLDDLLHQTMTMSRVCAVINGNHHLTVQAIADRMGISIGSCHQIFTEILQMHCVSAKFVLHFLTDDQKQNCLPMQMVMKTFLRTS
jgi:hypothetical protein